MSNTLSTTAVPESSGFISEKQLLEKIPVSRRTIWAWTKAGKIPCVRIPGGRRVLFHWPSVEAALLRKQNGGAR